MAVMAMMIQLFLSKVAFLSGAALLIAKIALLFSTLVRSQSYLSMLYATTSYNNPHFMHQ